MKRSLLRVGKLLLSLTLAAIGALYVVGALYAPPREIPRPFQGKHVQVRGVRLRVLQEGAGRDILFMHGSPGSLEDFAPQAQALSRSFRLTRYDRPGHGFSSVGESYSLAYNARIALALIEALALRDVIVVGHSYGGSSALALALLKSPRIAGYVVLDSAAYKHVRPVPLAYRLAAQPVLGLGILRALPRASLQAQVERGLRREFVTSPPPGFIALRRSFWAEPKVIHAMANEHVHSQAELSLQSPHYREITAPVYFAAQRDSAPRREYAERFRRDVPATVLELLPRTGHLMQFEQAEAVSRLIARAATRSEAHAPRQTPKTSASTSSR